MRPGLILVVLVGGAAAAAPLVAPYDPTALTSAQLESPSFSHLMGTDARGRDVFSRVLFGARLSLGAAFVTLTLIVTIGLTIGVVAGYYGGWVDSVLMRAADVILAVPTVVLALAIIGLLQTGLTSVILALSGVWWVSYGRLARGLVLAARERAFVESARALGASDVRIIARHLLPNVIPTVLVLATLDIGAVMLAVSALNFLGLGVMPPTPEWGAMINEGKNALFVAPHVALFPGLALTLTVFGLNLIGEGLADRTSAAVGHSR
jgi:peptide/nickel transport system permease protein